MLKIIARHKCIKIHRRDLKENMTITGTQLKMARAAIGITTRDLEKKSGVTATTITRIEGGHNAYKSTLQALQIALEALGVEFITEDNKVCVRLPKDTDQQEN